MNKKITVLFCLILAFVLLPFALRTTSAEGETSGQCGDNLDWSFDEESGTLTITGSGEMYDYSFYDAVPWAAYQAEIKYIELPDGLLNIGKWAFSYCKGVSSFTIPDTVETIGESALSDMSGLTSITIPASVKKIKYYAFAYCDGLTSLTIPKTVEMIETGFVTGCSSLTEISVDAQSTHFEDIDGVFFTKGAKFLCAYPCGRKDPTYQIPDSVEGILANAFESCHNLKYITIPGSVKQISYQAFYGCSNLGFVTILPGVERIGYSAFDACTALKTFVLPASLQQIRENTAAYWYALEDVYFLGTESQAQTVRENIVETGNGILLDADWHCTEDMTEFMCGDNLFWTFDEATGKLTITGAGAMWHFSRGTSPWYDHRAGITQIVLPNGLTVIGEDAFCDCNQFTSIRLPETLRAICMESFRNCHKLASIVIPDNVISVDDVSFIDCESLKTVSLGSSVEYLGVEAFRDCWTLETINIPASTYMIGDGVFESCLKLKGSGVTIDSNNADYKMVDGVLFSIDGSLLHTCLCGENKTSYTVPDNVKWIATKAFDANQQLKSVVLPNGLEDIGTYAFEDCGNLESINLPESITTIRTGAFYLCHKLDNVKLPSNLETIEPWTFSCCIGLHRIYLPLSVTSVGEGAFSVCNVLSDVYYEGTEEDRAEISIDNTNDDNDPLLDATWHYECYEPPFGQCGDDLYWELNKESGELRIYGTGDMWDLNTATSTYWYDAREAILSLTLESGMTRIGDEAFTDCFKVTSVVIPDTVTSIGKRAFYNCDGLLTVTLPASVTSISEETFGLCDALADVYYNGTRSDRALKLTIAEDGNDPLLNALWHYLTETVEGTVEWNSEDVQYKGTTAYVIANGTAQTPRFTVKNQYDLVIDPEFYDYEYKENTAAGTGYVCITFKGDYEGTCRGTFKIYLPATETTTVDNVADGIKLTWSAVPGADGYVIYRRAWSSTTDGWTDFVRWNNTTALEWLDTAVYAGTRYQYGIKAYFNKRTDPVTGTQIGGNVGDNYNLGEVGPLKTTVRITTRKLTSVTSGDKQLTIKWEATKNFTGIQVQYATNTSFTQNAANYKLPFEVDENGNVTTVISQDIIKNLTNGKTYYVRIRSYHIFNGTNYFGEWSNVLSVKVGKPTITTQPKSQTVTSGTSVTFKVVASGESLTYQWYYSKNNGSTWTKWSGKTSATLSFKGSATNNGYMYRCKVTSSYGYVYTNAAKLTVTTD